MPTYEYVCSKCEHHFDKFQRMSDAPLKVCPRELCPRKTWGKGKVTRAVGAGAGLIFKGSGFYITDYRSDNYKAAAKKDTPGGSDSAKKETKAAPAKETKSPSTSGGGTGSSSTKSD